MPGASTNPVQFHWLQKESLALGICITESDSLWRLVLLLPDFWLWRVSLYLGCVQYSSLCLESILPYCSTSHQQICQGIGIVGNQEQVRKDWRMLREWESNKKILHSNVIPHMLLQRNKTEASTVFPPSLAYFSQMFTFQHMLKQSCLKLH